jgi:hypothetical protein
MLDLSAKERADITAAYELAYFIVPDRGIALGIAEEACCALDVMLSRQEKTRRTYRQLLGFVKWEEKSRPLRTRVRLNDEQMLQWLVCYQSESWERATEYGSSHFPLAAEDMVVRYIKHLVRITLDRNSFYVTLAVTRLLYDYTTHEVRFLYDVLTASDSARMKDVSYLRKQKAVLLEEVAARFEGMLIEARGAYGERRFEPQPATDHLTRLAAECLRRFTPWTTACVVQEGFDPTSIPDLYFPGKGAADEDLVEMNRIHTILHPECFSRFIAGLSRFIRSLPAESVDKGCGYDAPGRRLAVPRFRNVNDRDSRDDRFTPPKLEADDYLRLQRTREARRNRRKACQPRQLRVYVDGVECAAFDPGQAAGVHIALAADAAILEVRGDDWEGELTLAAWAACGGPALETEPLKEEVVLKGGQKIKIQLRPAGGADEESGGTRVEVRYAETAPLRALRRYARRAWRSITETTQDRWGGPAGSPLSLSSLWKLCVAALVLLVALVVTWLRLRSPEQPEPPPPRVEAPAPPANEAPVQTPPTTPSTAPAAREPAARRIATARWNRRAAAAQEAILLGDTRGEITRVELSRNQREIPVALPQADYNGRPYTRYRVELLEGEKPVWQQALDAPSAAKGRAHVLDLTVSARLRARAESFVLRFDAMVEGDWQSLGDLTVRLVRR